MSIYKKESFGRPKDNRKDQMKHEDRGYANKLMEFNEEDN